MIAVRLLKPWKIWGSGHVIPEMPDNLARTLLARGLVEEIEPETKPAALKAPVDRAVRPSQLQRKSR